MNKYGQAAIKAVDLIESKHANTPEAAWEMATIEIFGEGTSGQSKGCPRSTFLALCETGKVKGIKSGVYISAKENKEYAVKALKLLVDNPSLSNDKKTLWNETKGGIKKSHNSQMDVVLALWNEGFIII
ncbi:DUF6979 family protein [Desulfosporosinus youngiae]|uniref:Uncharacterized protein n=1 Tax=Desulfosporosinus youngiae DSM 17734 TaxID=768710 RepID=H5Y0R1_9FIRM|nr:hypothetical protein [Desulfosporosinus youngiae]EHQ92317.1 hypothetical protein DesyoDRAFT_5391 [Desulfosporosinus youngiae DSM 17734]